MGVWWSNASNQREEKMELLYLEDQQVDVISSEGFCVYLSRFLGFEADSAVGEPGLASTTTSLTVPSG